MQGQELLWSSCGVAGRYFDAIPCFTDPMSYRGEISPERMREIGRLACQSGWQAAVDQVSPVEAARIRDERRADFRRVFDLPPDSAVLDVADRQDLPLCLGWQWEPHNEGRHHRGRGGHWGEHRRDLRYPSVLPGHGQSGRGLFAEPWPAFKEQVEYPV
jgi:hypothetical protein